MVIVLRKSWCLQSAGGRPQPNGRHGHISIFCRSYDLAAIPFDSNVDSTLSSPASVFEAHGLFVDPTAIPHRCANNDDTIDPATTRQNVHAVARRLESGVQQRSIQTSRPLSEFFPVIINQRQEFEMIPI
ncbi:hypothetical protein EKO27_g5570 [Xylaria grammica]|uniref:Uncharacterized protein n=1 Tax=Xylaria grammica TaxID=363999 RepID=A0A439D559_9PEZI|nr:hypothetical protein EKO27_g5570 [Xylaria grammica]